MTHKDWLAQTVEMAVHNVKNGGGPFAALIVKDGKVIGSGTNLVHIHHDPSAHAELLAIREACASLSSIDLSDCTLYASGEPCPMCLGAAYWATIGKIYYACSKTEALEGADYGNPLHTFFKEQQVAPEKRSVPFVQYPVETSLTPFLEWNRIHSKG